MNGRRPARSPGPVRARDLGPGRAAQRAQQPERDVAQLAVVGDEHQQADAGIGDARRSRSRRAGRSRSRCGPRGWRCRRGSMVVISEPAEGRERQQLGLQEAKRSRRSWLSVKTIAAAAANAPPLETPTSAGSASGLRNSPCMIAPAPRAGRRPSRSARSGESGSTTARAGRARRAGSAAPSATRPSAAGSRASGMPAAPTVSAISAAPTSANSRPTMASDGTARRAPDATFPVWRGLSQLPSVLGLANALIAGNSPSARPA